MRIEVSKGELIDKITILELKLKYITDTTKLQNVSRELDALRKHEFATPHKFELYVINESLWNIEDSIRKCEKEENFGDEFIQLARSVYKFNDKRSIIKKKINIEHGSNFVEEKSYA